MSDKEKVSGEEVEVVACRHSETGRSTADPVQDIARQLGIQTFGDGLLAKIRQTIDLLQEAAAERDQLRAEVERLTQEKANWVKWSKQLDAQLAQQQCGEYGDAYQGAREDLAIWKRRALEAEEKIRQQDQIIDNLVLEVQGETRMGEPYIAKQQAEVKP